jgi:hypothetical protein
MKLILLTFLMLAFLGFGLTIFLGIWSFKKRISWIKSVLFIFSYGVLCMGLLLFMIDKRKPNLMKRIPIVRSIKKSESKRNCDCTWSSLALQKDDYPTKHKPTAKRITNGMYIKNEASRVKWIRRRKLVPVDEAEGFGISNLDYSSAHLTPLAKKRLYELGHRFRASIQNPDEKKSYFMVSSITRSQVQQTQICERYPNACTRDHSPHSYGVAFDIYKLTSSDKNCNIGMIALQEVLTQMQREGKILLCPESKCIHVTVCG